MRIATAVAVLLMALGAAPAEAARVDLRFNGSYEYFPHGGRGAPFYDLTYSADAGEANTLESRPMGNGFRLTDSTAPITPGENCVADGAAVVCTPPGLGRVSLQAYAFGDGNDSAILENVRGHADLGAGDDSLVRVDTDPYPSEQNDVIVEPGPGADSVDATGARSVEVTYANRTAPVRATIGQAADDGEADEHDNLGPGVLTVDGGAAADTLVAGAGNADFRGGAGDDELTGGPGRDHLVGEEGDDVIQAGNGENTIYGGSGNDTLIGGADNDRFNVDDGADVIRGGPGIDAMDYERSYYDQRGVTVTLDDLPNDGLPFENDNVATDVEDIHGGQGPDHITGSDAPNRLSGWGGQDVLDGAGGADELYGNSGDTLIGGSGPDAFHDVTDSDRVVSRDGEQDRIDCLGPLKASIDGDPFDPGERCVAAPFIPLTNTRVKVDSRGRFTLTVRCEYAFTVCAGPVRVAYSTYANHNPRTYVLARGRFSTGGTRVQKLRFRLSLRWQRALRARRIWPVGAGAQVTRTLPQETAVHGRTVKLIAPRLRR